MEYIPKPGDIDVTSEGSSIFVSILLRGLPPQAIAGEWTGDLGKRLSKRFSGRAPFVHQMRVSADRIELCKATAIRARKGPNCKNKGILSRLKADIRKEVNAFISKLRRRKSFAPRAAPKKVAPHRRHFGHQLAYSVRR